MAIIDVMQKLEKSAPMSEDQIAEIIQQLSDNGMVIDYYFVDVQKLWQVVAKTGNDLQYFGSARELQLALADCLFDWFRDYDCE